MTRISKIAMAVALLGGMMAVSLAIPLGASAQTIRGRVVEPDRPDGIQAALVELLSSDSTVVRAGLSVEDGRFDLVAPGSATYRLRVQRFGYRTRVTDPFRLDRDTVMTVDLQPDPFPLEGFVVEGSERQCQLRAEDSRQTALLWDQVQKALGVTSLVQEQALLELEMIRFVRELNLEETRLLGERLDAWIGANPFKSPSASDLAEQGFVQPLGDDFGYYMPDPTALLSNDFLNAHCFRVVEHEDPGRGTVGLEFSPLDDRRERLRVDEEPPIFRDLFGEEIVDVRGVLWVDGRTGALQSLEYEYVGLREDDMEEIASGYAAFEQLLDGRWVVRRWRIRMPIAEFVGFGRSRRIQVTAIREEGGELTEAFHPSGGVATSRPGVVVTGRIDTKDLGIGVDSALVRLSGTVHGSYADASGGFRFDNVVPGEYLVTFHHPVLDTVDIEDPAAWVEVRPDMPPLVIPLPDRGQVLEETCASMDEDSEGGLLLLRISDEDGAPVPGREVQLRSAGEVVEEYTTARTNTLRFCEIPVGVPLEVNLVGRPDLTDTVTVPPHGFARRDVVVTTFRGGVESEGGATETAAEPGEEARLEELLSRPDSLWYEASVLRDVSGDGRPDSLSLRVEGPHPIRATARLAILLDEGVLYREEWPTARYLDSSSDIRTERALEAAAETVLVRLRSVFDTDNFRPLTELPGVAEGFDSAPRGTLAYHLAYEATLDSLLAAGVSEGEAAERARRAGFEARPDDPEAAAVWQALLRRNVSTFRIDRGALAGVTIVWSEEEGRFLVVESCC